MKDRLILDLCGGTGSWSRPYRDAGYRVIVVDPLADACKTPGAYAGTVAEFLADGDRAFSDDELETEDGAAFDPAFAAMLPKIHGILAAPPCDHFSVSGAQYWPAKDKDGRTGGAVAIVRECLEAVRRFRPVWWALENPIGRIAKLVPELGPPCLRFDPCDYGDPYTKRTQLWGKFRPPMKTPVEPVRANRQGSWIQSLGGKSAKTKRLRSMTPPGFAKAFFGANP